MATLLVIVVLALTFDFINGFHDAANSIATVVSTRVLSPRTAVVWAAFFNFVAFLVFGDRAPSAIDHTFRRLQLVSAGLYSLGHGGNDAQKTMGILVMALATSAAQPGLGWLNPAVGGYVYEPQPSVFAARNVIEAAG